MNPERWQQIEAIWFQALPLAGEARTQFVQTACDGDSDLLQEVASLIVAHERSAGFLAKNVVLQLAGTLPSTMPRDTLPRGTWPEDAEPCAVRRIGDYRLCAAIGQGGMSTVYLAERADGAFEQQVAIKLLQRGHESEGMLRRFRLERQILAHLDHPYIAKVYDGGTTEDGRPYFVMEYVNGVTIDRFCYQQQLQLAERLELMRKVCSAVHDAHCHLIVHRDLKPGNILVTAAGIPKLLDFGIAKLLDPAAFPQTLEATQIGVHPMTPEYASPEQHQGLPITTASDVFSLGRILQQLIRQLPQETATPRRPDDLDKVVQMALREEPGRRYASAEQLAEDLDRYLHGLPVRAERDTLRYRARKFLSRHRVAATAVALLLSAVVGMVVALVHQVSATRQERDRVEIERDRARQVATVLLDLFAGVDPLQAQGGTVTAVELLERGVVKAERELSEQKDVLAAALDAIGRVYHNLGLYQRATQLLETALVLRREVFGETHLEVAASLSHLGEVLMAAGDLARSEELLREALAIRQQLLGQAHPEVAGTMGQLVATLRRQGRLETAEQLQRQALEQQERLFPNGDPALAMSLHNLAQLRFDRGDWQAAEQLAMRALTMIRQQLGEHHPAVAGYLDTLANTLVQQGRFGAAEPLLRQTLALLRQVFGPEHPQVAKAMHSLGYCLAKKGALEEAEVLLQQALTMRRKWFPTANLSIGINLNALASVRRQRGDLQGAAELFHESLMIGRQFVPPDHPGLAYPLLDLGNVLLELGDAAAAEPLLREAHALRQHGLPAESPLIAESAAALGKCLIERRDFAAAEQILLASYRNPQLVEHSEPDSLAQVREQLVNLYVHWGQEPKAARYRLKLQPQGR